MPALLASALCAAACGYEQHTPCPEAPPADVLLPGEVPGTWWHQAEVVGSEIGWSDELSGFPTGAMTLPKRVSLSIEPRPRPPEVGAAHYPEVLLVVRSDVDPEAEPDLVVEACGAFEPRWRDRCAYPEATERPMGAPMEEGDGLGVQGSTVAGGPQAIPGDLGGRRYEHGWFPLGTCGRVDVDRDLATGRLELTLGSLLLIWVDDFEGSEPEIGEVHIHHHLRREP